MKTTGEAAKGLTQLTAWCWSELRAQAQPRADAPPGWLAFARQQGVLGLLSARRSALEPAARERLAQLAMAHLAREQELKRVAALLQAESIELIAFKGAAVSQWLYHPAYLRPRSDSDVLVRAELAPRLLKVLKKHGFEGILSANSGPVLAECSVARLDAYGVRQVLDVHWCVNSHPRLRHLLGFAELRSRAAASPYGSAIWLPDPLDQLFLSVVHLYGHQRGEPAKLIWWVDIDQMWRHFDQTQRAAFVEQALSKGLGALSAAALAHVAQQLDTPVAASDLQRLIANFSAEPSARLITYRGRLIELTDDLASLPGWAARVAWLKDLALPPRAYLEQRYGEKVPALPKLLLDRALGFWRQR